jgi:hypothetical protein
MMTMGRLSGCVGACLCAWAALLTTSLAGAELPRPEHPWPQAVRAEWLNLNGVWDFAETNDNADVGYLKAKPFPDKIVVPFCRESKLSGLERKGFVKNVWYRRTFAKPEAWLSQRVRLHVGACDYRTKVWLNGHLLGEHIGGNTAFCFEATPFLKPGENTLIVHAFDDTRSGLQPTGKQAHSEKSEGCVYTRTTGIWQTVWLEGVGSSFLQDFRMVADPANSRLLIQTEVNGPCDGLTIRAEASAAGKPVGSVETAADWRNGQLTVPLSTKRLWTLEDPFLYDLKLSLVCNGKVVDQVRSYFGLRDVTIRGAAILINGKAVFQRTVLDQGFYPTGVWTAPTDAALRNDIELSKAVGFNGARLHQKVFEPRFLYWADKLGYLVWGEFPNWGLDYTKPAIDKPVINEWVEILRRDRNHPAIIGWCPFNETPPEAGPLQATTIQVTRAVDPTRPVIESSGYFHGIPNPDALDAHDYDQNPQTFRARWVDDFGPMKAGVPARYGSVSQWQPVPFFVSEYGGIGWAISQGWGYGDAPKSLEAFYARFQGLTDALLDSRYHFGYCYTQLTNVEQEQNGLYTYDRKPKFDVKRLHAIQSRAAAYEKNPPTALSTAESANTTPWQVLVGANVDRQSAAWRYTTGKPAAEWNQPGFDDNAWKQGPGGFGHKAGAEKNIKTPWTTSDIWLRQEFSAGQEKFAQAMLMAHYDNETEVYVNGKQIWKGSGWNDSYGAFPVTESLKAALKPGKNTIAVHCHQDAGGQFIDVALLISGK